MDFPAAVLQFVQAHEAHHAADEAASKAQAIMDKAETDMDAAKSALAAAVSDETRQRLFRVPGSERFLLVQWVTSENGNHDYVTVTFLEPDGVA